MQRMNLNWTLGECEYMLDITYWNFSLFRRPNPTQLSIKELQLLGNESQKDLKVKTATGWYTWQTGHCLTQPQHKRSRKRLGCTETTSE